MTGNVGEHHHHHNTTTGTRLVDVSIQPVASDYDPLSTQDKYGNDPGIAYRHHNAIQIKHRAKFANIWCDHCNADLQRKYFLVTENATVENYPTACAIYCPGIPFLTPYHCWQCCSLPPNSLCPGHDHITTQHFDRGIYDRQGLCYTTGCLSGHPEFFPNEIGHVCCFQPCPVFFDKCCSCWWPGCCGERVRMLPHTSFCCCCPTRVPKACSCFGLVGVRAGDPWVCCLVPVAAHLAPGEAAHLANSLITAKLEWTDRSGKQ
jgi:hypothetical protein